MIKKEKILKIVLVMAGVLALTCLFEKGYLFAFRNSSISKAFSFDRIFLFFMVALFVGLHFLISVSKIWDFVYRKRYYIGIVLFAFIVINGYHGSSVYQYNNVIEPNYSINENAPFLSEAKAIRSDEFLVDTPGILSQIHYNDDFAVTNDAIMAREGTTVYMFPQLPTKSISVLSNPKMLGFLFLPLEQAYSFYWYILFFVCFFATFEVSMLITKGKKLYSALGACLLTFSPAFLWWNQLSIFASGFSAIMLLHLFLKTDSRWKKLVYSCLIGYAGCVYIMTLYPGWLLPFGYVFLGLAIWQLIDNHKTLRWHYLFYFIPAIAVMAIILLPGFIGSENTIKLMGETVYPGARVSSGGYGSSLLYNYLIAPFYPFIRNMGNPCEASQFIGLYPIPIFIGAFVCYKNKKDNKTDALLIILLVLTVFLGIWNYFDLPLFAKITLLSISTPDRAQLVINMLCILILLRSLSLYEKETLNKKLVIVFALIAVLFTCFGIYIVRQTYPEYVSLRVIAFICVLFIPLITLLLINNTKGNKVFAGILIAVSLLNLATVQPISKGLGVMSEKPIAKEVQKIAAQDKEAKWVVVNSNETTIFGQNYLLANGARVINSTNYYPNFALWHKFDPEKKYDEAYNRYAHIAIDIVEEETSFELLQGDLFKAKINKEELDKLEARYFVSPDDLTTISSEKYYFKEIYKKDNLGIYEFIYNS